MINYITYYPQQANLNVENFLNQQLPPVDSGILLDINLSFARFRRSPAVQELGGILQNLRDFNVKKLSLAHCDLDDRDASLIAYAIKTYNYSMQINLSGNKIQDAGVIALADAIKENPRVRLQLSDNLIGTNGAVAFVDASVLTAETKIDLSNNRIGDEGAKAIAEKLEQNPGNITRLVLKNNDIGRVGDRALAEKLPRNISVLHRTKHVPFVEAHPYLSCFLFLFVIPIFIIPFVKSEIEIEGCEHYAPRPDNYRRVPYMEAYPVRSLFMIVFCFPLIFVLPFMKAEIRG